VCSVICHCYCHYHSSTIPKSKAKQASKRLFVDLVFSVNFVFVLHPANCTVLHCIVESSVLDSLSTPSLPYNTERTALHYPVHASPGLQTSNPFLLFYNTATDLKQVHGLDTRLQELRHGRYHEAQSPLAPPQIFVVYCLVPSWSRR
jgi:hypothetical protein